MDGRTIAGRMSHSGGGVGRNMAEALAKLRINPCLVSAVGDDRFGSFLLDRTAGRLSTRGIMRSKEATTGTLLVLCDNTGECLLMVGDMDIHDSISVSHVKRHEEDIAGSSLVVLDGNLSQEATEFVLRIAHEHSVPVWFEPTDIFRASKPFVNRSAPPPAFISPNYEEFRRIYETLHPNEVIEKSNKIDECIQKGYAVAELVENVLITLGKNGVMIIRKGKSTDPFFTPGRKPKLVEMKGPISHRLYQPKLISEKEIVNVSGAGDCFASGFIAAMLRGEDEESCVEFGFRCSKAALQCSRTVPESF